MKSKATVIFILLFPLVVVIASTIALKLANQGVINPGGKQNGVIASQAEQDIWQAIAPAIPYDETWRIVSFSGCTSSDQQSIDTSWKAHQLEKSMHRHADKVSLVHLYKGEPLSKQDPSVNATVVKDLEQFPIASCPNEIFNTQLKQVDLVLLDPSNVLVMGFTSDLSFRNIMGDTKKLIKIPARKPE